MTYTPDPVIHAPLRLQIMTYLLETEKAGFNELKTLTRATQGNLSAHIARLEKSGYVTVRKSFKGRRPYTEIAITRRGIKALEQHFEWLRHTLDQWDNARNKK